jgi:DNA repair protein RadA/Sms
VQTENHGITLLISHLACAETPSHPLNSAQIRLFQQVRLQFRGVTASLANSSGIYLSDAAHFDMGRPGAALYGVNPTPGRPNPMQSVVELSGRILQIRNVERGKTVGYGASWTANRASRIAVAAVGYADGLPRLISGIEKGRTGIASVAHCRPHLDGSCLNRHSLSAGRRRAPRRSRDYYRRGNHDRRYRHAGRYDRLRDPYAPQPALPYRPSRRLSRRPNTIFSMVARTQNFVCQSCGAASTRWSGRCDACGAWNTLVEEGSAARPRSSRKGRLFAIEPLKGETHEAPRLGSGIAEFDRVTGGGLVRGSVLLLGGDPGIGKSTLLIEVAAAFAQRQHRAVYISGEEAVAQVRLRAERLGLADAAVEVAAETAVEDIVATLSQGPTPRLIIIDSIQTMWTQTVEAAPGTVTQVRGSAGELIRFAKRTGAAVVLVGHVTKDGQIAGPRVVEHMVDAVLSFEGEGSHQFRILRAIKNRFGPTDEIGVFEMTGTGLREVPNPSELFLSERDLGSPGTAVFAGIEGTRPLLVEIQALVAPTTLGTPRRAVVGWDPSRLSMVLAVLEAHCGIRLSGHDVYLNVAGGLRIQEPAADLAAAAALVSSLARAPLPADAVYFGEVSLSGAVRPVAQTAARFKEAQKLGFAQAIAPESARAEAPDGLSITTVGTLASLVADIARDGAPPLRRVSRQEA